MRLAQNLPVDLIAAQCSPLQRCRMLADALHKLRPTLTVQTSSLLAEMDFGDWEGKPWSSLGESALSAWTADFAHHRPGGGESVTTLLKRVDEAMQMASNVDGDDVLWITHAGVIKSARLLSAGTRHIERAGQWPTVTVGFGEWTVLTLPVSS
jgi:alpha-ribazole phosphatase